MISILKLFFLGPCSSIQMHASTNHVKLVTEQPKALSPIHRANSSSPVTFLNSSMALCMFDGLRRQMAQRRIRYRSPRIWSGQSTSYLLSCNWTLPNACPLCRRWHLGQLSGNWGMELRQSDLGCNPRHLKHWWPSSNNGQLQLGWHTFPSSP